MKRLIPASIAAATLLALPACQGKTSIDYKEPARVGAKAPEVDKQINPNAPIVPESLLEPAMDEKSLQEHAKVTSEGKAPVEERDLAEVRLRRRLDIDQLDASIRTVTGGVGWTETRNNVEINLFEDLAETLGKPDYLDSTNEDLAPTLIFQKFLGDAARATCTELAGEEARTHHLTTPAERHLMIHAGPQDRGADADAKIDANLRALLLNFHGTYVPQDDDARLNSWRWLYDSSLHVSDSPETAWRTVCVGLITHPDFYTY